MQTNTLRINSNLSKGSPSAQNFIQGLKKLKLYDYLSEPNKIIR